MPEVSKLKKIKSMTELSKAIFTDKSEVHCELAHATAVNLGQDLHIESQLETRKKRNPDLPEKILLGMAGYDTLMIYIDALCSEYGESENKAFREILAEVNNCIPCLENK